MEVKTELEKVKKQEEELIFKRFSNDDALRIGLYIIEAAKAIGKGIAIHIEKNGQVIFHHSMEGTAPDQEEWIKKKSNVVHRHYHSSYYLRLYNEFKKRSYFDFYSAHPSEYAVHGGSFPVIIEGTGVIGSITVSGLSQEEDHNLAVEAIRHFLNS